MRYNISESNIKNQYDFEVEVDKKTIKFYSVSASTIKELIKLFNS